MRFIYHHRTAGRGGEGLHITSVVNALRANGHDVLVVSPPAVDPMKSVDAVPLDKGDVRASGLVRLWAWVSRSCPQPLFEVLELGYNFYAFARLLPALRKVGPAVYYERYAFLLVAGVWAARLCGRRVILEVNEVSGVHRARGQTFVRLARLFERWTFSCADEITTVSSYLQKEVLARGGRPGHVHVVPNAIDPVRFERPSRRGAIRARYDIGDAPVLGFVGWFDHWDRLDRLVDLVDELRPACPALRLMLVGDGPVATELAQAVRDKGLQAHVVLTGPVGKGDVPDYIGAMDICILPDSNEFGSPIVLFEFMAMGRTVVAADVPPVLDVVEDGVTGLIVSRADPGALRAAVETLLHDPARARRMGDRARQRVMERHTWHAVAAVVEVLAVGDRNRRATLDAAEVGAR
jgi:glycosyltransferase involved in cell wall biosynthesis